MASGSKFWLACFLLGLVMQMMGGRAMADSVRWADLGSNEQAVLKPFIKDWDVFPEAKQKTLRRWAGKPASERARIREHYAEWNKLNREQQQTVVRQLKHYKQMSAAQRARVKAWHQWVKKLPDSEQQKLRQLWPAMGSAARKNYMQDLQKKYGGRPN
jgi:uncharacterized protein (DUF2336 family)